MLLLTHKPKPISLARQRRDSLEASSPIPEVSIVVDLGTSDLLEECMILLDFWLEVDVDEFKNFRDKLIESGLNKDLLPAKYHL